MNQTKRKLTNDDEILSDKKHRHTFVVSQFEQLSNEILYEIFDYLDGYDVFHGFFHLNQRFQTIFSCLLFKISFRHRTFDQLSNIYKHILVPYQQQILAIDIDERMLYHSQKPSSSFVTYLKNLSRPFSLRLHVSKHKTERFPDIHKQILTLSHLESFQLIHSAKEKLNLQVPIPTEQRFSSLKSLNLSCQIYFNEFISILHYSRQLQCLSCERLLDSNSNSSNIETLVSNLCELKINNCQVIFDDLRRFLCRLSSSLELLRINDYYAVTFALPEYWEQLISQHLRSLNSIRIKCNLNIIVNDSISITRLINIHKYRFRLEIQPTEIFYIISSFIPSNDLFRSSQELSINYRSIRPWHIPNLDQFQSMLQTIPFTSLHFFASGMSVNNFMKLLSFLPNLQSLKILSSLHFQDETIELLNHINQIRHVWTWFNFQHIQLLTQICTQMNYLEIIGIRNEEFRECIEFIFEKMSTDLTHLRQFRFYVYNSNDSILNILKSLIVTRRIFQNYRLRFDSGFVSLNL